MQINLKSHIKRHLVKLPYVRTLNAELEKSRATFPPGHFYSPIPSEEEIERRKATLFDKQDDLLGIDLNTEQQVEYLRRFSEFREQVPFFDPSRRIRYDIENDMFSHDDGPILSYMMRLCRPHKVIEIGSGHSSACMLDTSDLYLDGQTSFMFVDPYCDNLRQVLIEEDYQKVAIIEKPVQDVDPSVFCSLSDNDMLFIDSSHIVKTGSDVNTIIFQILPRLNPGVHIHFHDVRYPFEYLESNIGKGFFWNEAYCLRAFLQHNSSFKIVFWLNYLINAQNELVREFLSGDLADDRDAGGSLWLAKV